MPREEWPNEFAILKQSVMRAAPSGAYIHHIGSTAVRGLPAKDVIDIQLTVGDLSQVDDTAFAREGFNRVLGKVDHSPPGLDLPEKDLLKRFFKALTGKQTCIFGKKVALISSIRSFAGITCARIH